MKKNLLLILFISVALISKGQNTTQLWGMTTAGGTFSKGNIFKINPDGTGFTNVFDFNSPDGYHPHGNLIQASDGNLYSTCYDGGGFASCTIFQHDPLTNNHVDIYDFDITHGDYPESGVVEAPDGLLYGVSKAGGVQDLGVIYSIDPISNIYTDLYEFSWATGEYPFGVPIVSNGKLYGTTSDGGLNTFGVIYSFDLLTHIYTDIYDLGGISNGGNPFGSLIMLSDGKLYGMNNSGGLYGCGVIFSFNPLTNSFQKLHDFLSTTGGHPLGTLIQASNNKLYGVTQSGGGGNGGVIFSYDLTTNSYVNMVGLSGVNGSQPTANLMQATNGKLYGTTAAGGVYGNGVIFSYDLTTNTFAKLFDFNGSNGSTPQCGLIEVEAALVGISDLTSSNETISLYPNPATNQLNITINNTNYKTAQITITNIIGEKVLPSVILSLSKETINITSLPKGMYFVETIVDGKRSVMKFVKE